MIFLKFKLFNISYMKLQKLIKIKKGQQLNKEFLYKKNEKDINLFPVINGGKEPSGWWWKSNFDKNLITISQGVASCGYVQWQHTKFWAGAHCYVIMIIHNKLNYKFIYYFLKNKEKLLMKNQKGAGIPSLDTKTIYNLEIPILPMEIQNKIVEILDKFTNYKAELTAELTFRKEQYKYYRDTLFYNLNKNSDYKYLWEITKWNKSFSSVNKFKQTEKINIKSVSAKELKNLVIENGDIRLISTGKFDGYTNQQIAKDKVNRGEVILLPEGGSANLKYHNGKFVNALNLVCSSIDNNIYLLKYIYYFLSSNIQYIESCYRGSGVRHPDMREILDIKIPISPIEVQNKIVEILDKFSSLINDIFDGLPREIELRNKQYEYYRNLLLNFEDKSE